jgi:thymidylate synthase ThyX
MNQELKRNYHIDPEHLPYQENLEKFAPAYTPENFSDDEIYYLTPFFTNLDKPVFIVKNLPEEVIAALSSRYSRSTCSLRRTFLLEYIDPIVHPDKQKEWSKKSKDEQEADWETRRQFLEFVNFLNSHQGIEKVVNVQRARGFFKKWLAGYGDDSIAEMAGIHLMIEGLSNIATKEIEDKRVGISPLEKSSRYVSFSARRPDGGYFYVVPGEVKGMTLEYDFQKTMDLLFNTYAQLEDRHLDYIKSLYPKGMDETDGSFERSRGAKRFDDIRDLLPFATQTNVALHGNGRAFEDLVNRLMCHPLGELRYWGQQMLLELKEAASNLYSKLAQQISPYVAQYAVPFAYLQHWYMTLTAREIYWMVELRTGPQGRPHYREICQQIAKLATCASPSVFSGILCDWNDYPLARRESEKKVETKVKRFKD